MKAYLYSWSLSCGSVVNVVCKKHKSLELKSLRDAVGLSSKTLHPFSPRGSIPVLTPCSDPGSFPTRDMWRKRFIVLYKCVCGYNDDRKADFVISPHYVSFFGCVRNSPSHQISLKVLVLTLFFKTRYLPREYFSTGSSL